MVLIDHYVILKYYIKIRDKLTCEVIWDVAVVAVDTIIISIITY